MRISQLLFIFLLQHAVALSLQGNTTSTSTSTTVPSSATVTTNTSSPTQKNVSSAQSRPQNRRPPHYSVWMNNVNLTVDRKLICNTEQGKIECPGACVVKKSHMQLWPNPRLSIGCQAEVGNETRNTINKCHKDRFNGRPYALEYGIKDGNENHIIVYKTCCWANYCNEESQAQSPLLYIRWMLDKDMQNRSVFLIFSVLVLLVVILASATYRLWKYLNPPVYSADNEYSIDPLLIEAAGEYTVIQLMETVTGHLSIAETSTVITEMTADPDIPSTSSTDADAVATIMPAKLIKAGGNGHTLVKAVRHRPHHLQSILFRMIEHGPYEFPFRPMELIELFDEAKDVFFADDALVRISSPVVVISDLRGSYSDLHRWLSIIGWPPRTKLLFLGNSLENDEPGSLECISLIAALKIAFPYEVFALRGVTESLPYYPAGRFPDRTVKAISSSILRMCSFMPTSAVLMERILAVPSGISPQVLELSDLCEVPRPVSIETMSSIQRDLIFDQPSSLIRMHRPNPDSRGDFFGSKAVERTRDNLGVHLIIRGGSPVPYGYLPSFNHTLLSVWSAPAKGTQIGAILIVYSNLEVEPIMMQAQDEMEVHTKNLLLSQTGEDSSGGAPQSTMF